MAHFSYCIVLCLPERYLTSTLPISILNVAGSNLNRDRLYFLCVQNFPLQSDIRNVAFNSTHSSPFTFHLLPTILTFCSNHGRPEHHLFSVEIFVSPPLLPSKFPDSVTYHGVAASSVIFISRLTQCTKI